MKKIVSVVSALALFSSLNALAASDATTVKRDEKQDFMVTDTQPYRLLLVSSFRKGEGCMQGFKRIGYTVRLKDCVKAAEAAGIDVLWYRPNINKPATTIIPVKEGDPFGVLLQDGKQIIVLYKNHVIYD